MYNNFIVLSLFLSQSKKRYNEKKRRNEYKRCNSSLKKLTLKANTINLDKKECIVEKIATKYQVKQVVKRVVK